MKNRSLLLLIVTFCWAVSVEAQYVPFSSACPGCVPNTSAFGSPGPEQYGLSPQLIVVNQNTPVDLDVTFLLPPEYTVGPPVAPIVVTADINKIDLISIDYNGVTGLEATPDALNFNPQNNRYGCMKICGQTPTAPGNYTISVKVYGEGSAVGQTAGDTLFVDATVIILPPGNPYITSSPPEACTDTANVTVAANMNTFNTLFDPSLNPTEFSWVLPNGATATGENPPAFDQFGVGDHVIQMTAITNEYIITEVSGNVVGSWWAGLFDDGALIGGSNADVQMSVVSGSNSGSGGEIGNDNSPTWDLSGNPVVLGSQAVTLSFVENDVFDTDNGGLASININNGAGSYPFSAFDGGTNTINGTVTIGTRPLLTETYYDTITIHPSVDVLTADAEICAGDSVLLEATAGMFSYIWFNANGDSIGTGESIYVYEDHSYYVQDSAVNGALCTSNSGNVAVSVTQVDLPVIEITANGGLFVENSNSYGVQWFANGSGIAIPIPSANMDTLASFNPNNAPFTVEFTSGNGCSSLSDPFEVCLGGTSSSASSSIVLGSPIEVEHEDFALKPGNDVAWAFSLEGDGQITDMAGLQLAIDAGWVLPSSSDSSIMLDCNNLPDGVENGNYYLTPFSSTVLSVDSILWNPAVDSGCIPDASFCIEITGTDWLILGSSLVFTFPDGTSVNVIDELIPPGTLPPTISLDTLTPDLIDLIPIVLPGGLCFQLSDLYNGDPNGTWSVSAQNVGTGAVNVEILDFTATVYADSCSLLTTDQITNIPGTSGSIAAGGSSTLSFTLPPVSADFPTINSDCSVFGDATLLTVNCETAIEDVFDLNTFAFYPNPNNGNFTVELEIKERSEVQIQIVDVTGRSILNTKYPSVLGSFNENFNLSNNLSPGFYVLNLRIGEDQIQKHFIIK